MKKKNDDKNNYKFRHHSHYTGKCRSAAHGICSLNYIIPKESPKILYLYMTIQTMIIILL